MAILFDKSGIASHWYDADGNPVHEVPANKGGMRPTTIKDARKLGLLPSVTNVLGVLAKPQLDTWKAQQVALAAIRNPKTPGESDDYYVERIVEASKQPTVDAADLGSRIHEALEHATAGEAFDDSLAVYVRPVLAWMDEAKVTLTRREFAIVNGRFGYAGRCDAAYTRPNDAGEPIGGVLDFKTRKTTPGRAIEPYDGQGAQLAAYAAAVYPLGCLDAVECINIYISTTEPGRIEAYVHEDPVSEFNFFLNVCAVWRHVKGYDPRKGI